MGFSTTPACARPIPPSPLWSRYGENCSVDARRPGLCYPKTSEMTKATIRMAMATPAVVSNKSMIMGVLLQGWKWSALP